MVDSTGGPADRETRQLVEQARTLRGMLRAGAVVLGALTLWSAFANGPAHALIIYGVGVALHLGHLAALRTGRTRLVAQSHCVTYLVWITGVLAFSSGGLGAPAALVYPPIVLLSGLVWSGRAALGMALAVSACGAALVELERHGLLPAAHELTTPVGMWVILSACVVITAAILRFSLGIIHRSTEEAFKLEERLRQGERLEALGRLAGGVAHDLNNLLTIILGNAELARSETGGVDDRALGEIRGASERAAALTRRLLAFGRRQLYAPGLIDVGRTVAAFEPLLRRLLPEDVELILEREPGPASVLGDPAQLEQVVMNLVANARDAMPEGGQVRVSTSLAAPARLEREPDLPEDAVWLVVTDGGAGMTAEVKAHLFEPFFTTKPPAKGTGLGLATVHGIVSQSGGRIFVDSKPGRGTSFAIALPRAREGAAAAVVARVALAVPAASATILVVEDDPAVRGVATAILRGAQFTVLAAGDSSEAESASAAYLGKIDLLLTDVVMHGQSGPRMARALRGRRADLKILYVSGHDEDMIATRGVLRPGIHFLAKPFTRDSLLEKVRDVLASAEPGDVGM